MPQMSPMNWIILFMSFIFLMIMIFNKIFYLNLPPYSCKSDNMSASKLELKWLW